jgi:MFS family permease
MPPERVLTRPFLLCSLANLLQALSFNLFLHLPGFLHELGASEVRIGVIGSITAVAAIAVRRPLGPWMDRRGRRPAILLGGLLNTTVCALYLTVHSLGPWIYTVRVLHGLAEALLFTGLFTLAADWVPTGRRTEGLALFGVSGMLPISLGGLLGDVILQRAGYGELFLAASGAALTSLLLSLPLVDRPRDRTHEEPSRGFAAAAAQRDLLPLWFAGTIFAIALAAVFTFIKRFVMETGIGSVGLFFTTYAGAAVVVRVFLGRLPDRVGAKRVLLPALGTLALGFALLAFAQSPRDVAWAGLLCGVGHGYTFPILFSLVVTRSRESERGAAMSIFTALFDVGVLVGGPSLGWMIEAAGFPAMFAAASGLLVAGGLLFALWDRRASAGARSGVDSRDFREEAAMVGPERQP